MGGRRLSGAERRPRQRQISGARPRSYRRRSGTGFLRAFYTVGMVLVIAAIAHASYGYLLTTPHFRVTSVEVKGLSKPVEDEIRQLVAAHLDATPSMITVNLGSLKRTLAAHPRVKDLKLDKVYPDQLVVTAAERAPLAILNAGGFFLIDREGFVMEEIKASQLRAYDLPYITGVPDEQAEPNNQVRGSGIERALDLVLAIRTHNKQLFEQLSEVNVGKDPVSELDNITAFMSGGMEVRFGDTNPVEKLPSLDLFIRMQREKGADPFSMDYVDLRFKNQIVFMDAPHALAKVAGVLDKVTPPPAQPKKAATASAGSSSAQSSSQSAGAARESAGTRAAGSAAPGRSAYDLAPSAGPAARAPHPPPVAQAPLRRMEAPAAETQPRRGIVGRMTNIFRRDGAQ